MWLQSIFQKYFRKKSKSLNTNVTISAANSTISIANEPRIIIIGAGAAGLACAMKLREFGFENILILEAENRIGGRIYTKPFADNVVDLGAQWVHGEVDNVVYNMVQQHNCLESSGKIYETFECIRSNGEIVPASLVDRLKSIIHVIFDECGENMDSYDGSYGEYLTGRFNEALRQPEMQDIDMEIAMEFFENFKRIESSESSSGVDEMSAKGFNEYWQCPGDYLLNWKEKGYVTFLHMLLGIDEEKLLGDLENFIKFECRVDHIQWDNLDHKVTVICDSGKQHYVADHVVITVSLGVLKEHFGSMFHPPLPLPKKCAIVGLGYGSVCKIYLEFPKKFWADNWYGFTTLWRQKDSEELRKSQLEWVEEIFGFYCVNYQPRVLVAWLVGPYVLKVEQMSPNLVNEGCMYLLRRFLKKWQIPDTINIQVTSWQSNPNFAGAYSFRSMLSEELNASALQLSQPLTVLSPQKLIKSSSSSISSECGGATMDTQSSSAKPILLFAGEATSMHHFSTVHGAVESGHREAQRLLHYYRQSYS